MTGLGPNDKWFQPLEKVIVLSGDAFEEKANTLTQSELAKRSGMTQNSISAFEQAYKTLTIRLLRFAAVHYIHSPRF